MQNNHKLVSMKEETTTQSYKNSVICLWPTHFNFKSPVRFFSQIRRHRNAHSIKESLCLSSENGMNRLAFSSWLIYKSICKSVICKTSANFSEDHNVNSFFIQLSISDEQSAYVWNCTACFASWKIDAESRDNAFPFLILIGLCHRTTWACAAFSL